MNLKPFKVWEEKKDFDPAAMRDTFNIPECVEPVALLVMGYPSEDARPLDLHFRSRPIDETVFYEDFK